MTNIKKIIEKEELLKQGITQNELSKITGVSNTYINYLRTGKIISPGREKIIAICAGLNYSIDKIDIILQKYGFKKIFEDDFEIFFKIAKSRNITGIQPFYEDLNYDLLLYSIDSLPGDKILINKKPSATLEPPEYLLWKEKRSSRGSANPVYGELRKVLALERKKMLRASLKKWKVTYIVCRECFNKYTEKISGEEPERGMVIKHLRELVSFIENEPNYDFILVDQCARMRFTLKYCKGTELGLDKNKLLIYGYGNHTFPQHNTHNNSRDRLLGIATDSSKLFEHFVIEKDDYLENYISKESEERKELIKYIDKKVCEKGGRL